jgi:hypothetical protein
MGVAASAQFTGITGVKNQGGIGVLPATGTIGTVFNALHRRTITLARQKVSGQMVRSTCLSLFQFVPK